jgi:hypothetical protein
MRKLLGAGLLVLMAAQPIYAQQPASPRPQPTAQTAQETDSSLMARVGFFVGQDSVFREVYGGGIVIGSEMRIALPGFLDRRLTVWAEGNYRSQNGGLTYTHDVTTVKVGALEGGLLYRLTKGMPSIYVGGGFGYYLFSEDNEPMGSAKQNALGFCGLAAASVPLGSRLVMDVRLKYSSSNMQPADLPINVGGLTLDAGFGIRF